MEASVKTLFEYLGTDKINKIPVYQRNYDWDTENCTQLFKDIVETGDGDNTTSHFIGSIIAIVKANIEKTEHIVIDGQQRITSSFLFLKALYDFTEDDEYIRAFVNEATVNKKRSGNILKLELNKKDNEILKKLFSKNPKFTKDESSKLYKNYLTFKKLIEESKVNSEILENGFKRLKVVAISLQPNDAPQSIFEALNSTGMKLRTADLIRNHLLMEDVERQEDLYTDYWLEIEEFLPSQYLEAFIKAFTMIKTGKNSTAKNLYSDFKNYFISEKISVEDILKELLFYAEIYSYIIFGTSEDKEIKQIIGYIEATEINVVFPVILEGYVKYERGIRDKRYYTLDKKELIDMLLLLENYLIRNVLIDNPSNGYNKFVPKLIKRLSSYKSFKWSLISNKSKNLTFVSDKTLREKLSVADIYKNKAGKYLLYRIEQKCAGNEVVGEDKLTIEHIFPQTDNKAKTWKHITPELLHTLGNLTLTGYNSELSNKQFSDLIKSSNKNSNSELSEKQLTALIEKESKKSFNNKKSFFEISNLSMNKEIAKNDNWTDVEIKQRTAKLTDEILKIWKEPEGLNDEIEISEFDLSDFSDMPLTGRKIESFIFGDEKEVKLDEWKDLYFQMVEKLFVENRESFDSHWKNKSFKFIFSDNDKTSSREKVSDTFFLQTQLQANSILRNLSTIFGKLNIDKNELTIKLVETSN